VVGLGESTLASCYLNGNETSAYVKGE